MYTHTPHHTTPPHTTPHHTMLRGVRQKDARATRACGLGSGSGLGLGANRHAAIGRSTNDQQPAVSRGRRGSHKRKAISALTSVYSARQRAGS